VIFSEALGVALRLVISFFFVFLAIENDLKELLELLQQYLKI
jgi:hypothetical protein